MWTERTRIGCAETCVNSRLEGDYFFNRSTVSGCPSPYAKAYEVAEKIYWPKNLDCYIYDREGLFETKGFSSIDTMYVLKLANVEGYSTEKTSDKIVIVDRSALSIWVEVFCKAFSVPNWRAEVQRIMNANMGNVTLILSYMGSAPAACAALYLRDGVAGIYCLGTIPQLRGRGVAAGILKKAASTSENLFLQTFSSENLLPFYKRVGFKVTYTKKIYIVLKPNAYPNKGFQKPT